MPVNPGDGETFSREVAERLRALEVDLLTLLRDLLRKDAPTDNAWVAERLAELQWFRRRVHTASQQSARELDRLITSLVQRAYNNGSVLAFDDLDRAGFDVDPSGLPAVDTALVLSTEAKARSARALGMLPGIFSAAYSDAVAAGATAVLSGQLTRLQAAQVVLDRLFSDGVTGFTDAAGRRWSLPSYVEMAVRTATGHAAVDGHVAQLRQAGLDLVVVSDAPRECPLCRPWEGKVLSLGGSVAVVQTTSVTTGKAVQVRVAGSLAQARAAGLQHPNCRHNVSAYLPGASAPVRARPEPQGYDAQQRQREIERRLREWKRRAAYALTPEAEAKAKAKSRAWSRELARHVEANGLKRQRHRERVSTAVAPLAR